MPFDGNVIRSTRNANVRNLDVALANIQIYKQMFIKCKKLDAGSRVIHFR